MAHPMSEFSHRSHDIFRQGIPHTPGPFSPEELPSIQYEMHGETTVDQRATEMLRKPTEAEIKQLGDPYRSDLNPHNYRFHSMVLKDSDFGAAPIVADLEVQLDFQCWAVVFMIGSQVDRAAAGLLPAPNGSIIFNPFGYQPNFNSAFNFPYGHKPSITYFRNGAVSTGWFNIYFFDRWIPSAQMAP